MTYLLDDGKFEHIDRACGLYILLQGNLCGLRAAQSCALHEDNKLKGTKM